MSSLYAFFLFHAFKDEIKRPTTFWQIQFTLVKNILSSPHLSKPSHELLPLY